MSNLLTPTPEERRLRRAIASRVDPLLRQPVALLRPDAVLEVRSPALLDDRPAPGADSRERRMVPVSEVRFLDEEEHPGRFRAVVLRYGVVDNYNTVFEKGVFTASMAQRMPRIVWAHRWDSPIGRWIDFEETDSELILTGELDLAMISGTDQPAVPLAHQARAQLRSGTIDQFSVGFMRTADRDGSKEFGKGVRVITGGVLDEVSLVLVGAVPGTHTVDAPRHRLTLSVRMPGAAEPEDSPVMVPLDEAARIISRMSLGELDLADGLTALKALATTGDDGGEDEDTTGGEGDDGPDAQGDATNDGGDGAGGHNAGEHGSEPSPNSNAVCGAQGAADGADSGTATGAAEPPGSAGETGHTGNDGDGEEDPDADLLDDIDKALEVIS